LDEVATRGKHLLFRMEGAQTIHSHLGMEGEWVLQRPGDRWRLPGHQARLIIENAGAVAIGYRLKVTEVIATSDEERVLGHLGPDVLGPDWDEREAIKRVRSRVGQPIGEVLIDQTVMAGPGNVYKSEVCFLRGVNPFLLVEEVPDPDALVKLIKRLMEVNRATGRQVTTGDLRRGRGRWVYGRGGRPCRRCRMPILRAESSEVGGRVTYWCPACQPGPPQADAQRGE
jgi:endonuclease-8